MIIGPMLYPSIQHRCGHRDRVAIIAILKLHDVLTPGHMSAVPSSRHGDSPMLHIAQMAAYMMMHVEFGVTVATACRTACHMVRGARIMIHAFCIGHVHRNMVHKVGATVGAWALAAL